MKHLRSTVLVMAVAACPMAAQSAPCESLNDSTNNVVPTSTPFVLGTFSHATAYVITAQQTHTVRAIRILTRSTALGGGMGLEIHSRDPGTGFPGSLLGRGACYITNGVLGWLGVNLDRPVALTQGTRYVLVWREPGGSQMPHDPTGTQIPRLTLGASGWHAMGKAALKYRLFCSLLDSANLTPIGNACTSSQGTEGTLFSNLEPLVGQSLFVLEGSGFYYGYLTSAWLLLGVDPTFASKPLPGFPAGCMLHTDVVVTAYGLVGVGWGVLPGYVRFPLGIPNNRSLAGATFRAQLAVYDRGSTATIGMVTSNGLIVRIL